MSELKSIILGDNPFTGVDHLSCERGRERVSNPKKFENALNIMEYCHKKGINKMVLGSNPLAHDFINYVRENSNLIKSLEFYPLIPYAQGYIIKIDEKGVLNTLKEIVNSKSLGMGLKLISKGGLGYLKKDLFTLFKLLIDIELLTFKELNIKTVFLHETLTDLAMALELRNIVEVFQNHLEDEHQLKAGLVTKNFPHLISKLDKWNLKIPNIMTSFNKAGFQMNPSRNECEKYLKKYNGEIIAMSPLAGGYNNPTEAFDYLTPFSGVKKIVVGISSISHAEEICKIFLNR